MNLLSIPSRYMRAKWARTLLLLVIFVLGVSSMTALELVARTVGHSYEQKLISYGANILVTPRRDTLRVSYGGYTLGNVTVEERSLPLDQVLQAVEGIDYRANLAVIAPKLLSTAQIKGQTVGVIGVIWDEELNIKSYWDLDGDWPTDEQALVGAAAAAKLGLALGDTVEFMDLQLPVAGILHETGSDDDNVIFISLPVLQQLTQRLGEADFLEVAALCSGCPIDDIVNSLRTALPDQEVLALRQVAESQMYSVHFAQNLTFYVSLVILVTACATVFMAMLSAVNERRKEIGIMRSVGFSRANVFTVFCLEAVLIGLASGLLGFVIGHNIAVYVLSNLHLVEDVSMIAGFNWALFFLIAVGVSLIAAVAALFPSWKASRIEPTEALALA